LLVRDTFLGVERNKARRKGRERGKNGVNDKRDERKECLTK